MDGGCIVVMRFTSAAPMNTLLDPISDRVDGPIRNRMGHNFPRDELTTAELQRVLPKQVGCTAQTGVGSYRSETLRVTCSGTVHEGMQLLGCAQCA